MSELQQIGGDLHYVRAAVARRDSERHGPSPIYWIWAAYVLIGYALIDFDSRAANWFFLIAGVTAALLTVWIGRRHHLRLGEIDRRGSRRVLLHFFGGGILAVAAVLGLSAAVPALRGPQAGQVAVVLFGLLYFLAGVHFDPNFLWLGPVLILGGILVGKVPHYGWTALGIVIALGLVVPTLLPHRKAQAEVPAESAASEER